MALPRLPQMSSLLRQLQRVLLLALLGLLLAGGRAAARCSEPAAHGPLHVASPDWREQVIYFALTDRFDDGDASNNDQGSGEYDPTDPARYSGGDLCGLRRRLDYIAGLGATALWITPPVAQQWWDGSHRYGGYHGYWAEDFRRVDAHLGTLRDYRELARALHSRGMYLVQDVVVNHVGNFFDWSGTGPTDDATAHYRANPDSRPHARPTQWPFSLNDPRRARDRRAAIYHWTSDITDFTDVVQERSGQLAGLDDLNTENPRVRRALRRSYGDWIRRVGVDAFRIDTAFYVPPDFFADFLRADERAAPGILRVAAATGRRDFLAFGEGFGVERPYDNSVSRRIDAYVRDADGAPLLPAMLDFPLYGSTLDVFARGHPSAELGQRLRALRARAGDPQRTPRFVDNHDVDRFLAGGSEAGLKQALLLILSLPGIPVIYYGTEQGYTVQRAAMFAGGVGAGGRDHFDTQAPLYRYLQRVIALRRTHPVLSHGLPEVLADNGAAPGALAYLQRDAAARALVVFNSADTPSLLDHLATGLAPGTRLHGLFAIDGDAPERVVDAQGELHLVLPPRSGLVWEVADTIAVPAATAAPTLEALPAATLASSVWIARGTASPGAHLAVVRDGDIAHAVTTVADARGRWQATLDLGGLVEADVAHRLVAWDGERGVASAPQSFRVAPQWRELARSDDPPGDDHGPDRGYRYPTDASWQGAHPLDLRAVRVLGSGTALRLEVELQDMVATWNPPNGFDHLALTVFVAVPGRDDGVRALPLQQAEMPAGLRWHYRLRVDGWNTAWFGSQGADAAHEGRALSPAPLLRVERDAKRLVLLFPAGSFGELATLSGLRLYLTTWDYDGAYRALAPQPAPHTFGGAATDAPKVMDDSAVIMLP